MKLFFERWFLYYLGLYSILWTIILSLPFSTLKIIYSALAFIYNNSFRILFNQPLYYFEFVDAGPDSYESYFIIFLTLLFTLMASLIFYVKDNKWMNRQFEKSWITFIIKVFFAKTMIYYGSHKVLPVQFPDLTLFDLLKPIGEYSPGNFLWSFMSYSPTYQIISGVIEVLAGLFILIPRLSNLGALLGIIVMSHVFLLNIFYDVTVKQLSFHLLISCIFVILNYFKGWLLFFRLIESKNLNSHTHYYDKPLNNKFLNQLTYLLFIIYLFVSIYGIIPRYEKQNNYAKHTPFYGLWKISKEQNIKNHLKWKRFIFSEPEWLFIQTESDQFYRLHLTKKEGSETDYIIQEYGDYNFKSEIKIENKNNLLFVSGLIDQKNIQIELQIEQIKPSILESRPFQLISEDWYGR